MRPERFSELAGQPHLFGPDKLLARLIRADRVPSLILWGPPGTGKTTTAEVIARETAASFEAFSAVLGGVADLRKILGAARERARVSTASAPSCSWTRSTASTRGSRTHSCRTWRTAPSR
jgi:putative ATPase